MALSKITAISMAAVATEATCPLEARSVPFSGCNKSGVDSIRMAMQREEVQQAFTGCSGVQYIADPEVLEEGDDVRMLELLRELHMPVQDDSACTPMQLNMIFTHAKTQNERLLMFLRFVQWMKMEKDAVMILGVPAQFQLMARELCDMYNVFAETAGMPKCAMVDIPGARSYTPEKVEQPALEFGEYPCAPCNMMVEDMRTAQKDQEALAIYWEQNVNFMQSLCPETDFGVDTRAVVMDFPGLSDCVAAPERSHEVVEERSSTGSWDLESILFGSFSFDWGMHFDNCHGDCNTVEATTTPAPEPACGAMWTITLLEERFSSWDGDMFQSKCDDFIDSHNDKRTMRSFGHIFSNFEQAIQMPNINTGYTTMFPALQGGNCGRTTAPQWMHEQAKEPTQFSCPYSRRALDEKVVIA